jgi:hypothetical protein
LQGTSSAFGRWLDQVLDELADLGLHAAIAWAAFAVAGHPMWLVLGIVYASGKYLFLVQSLLGDELERQAKERNGRAQLPEGEPGPLKRWFRAAAAFPPALLRVPSPQPPQGGRRSESAAQVGFTWLAGLLRNIGHADVRWHLWIALAILGRLEIALLAYAVYYPSRAVAGALRKGARYA